MKRGTTAVSMKTEAHWKKVGRKPHHGLVVPLFSLHSEKRGASASFLDLIPLITWCQKIGFDTLQLLPLNDTGEELSPYNPLSSCALHPKYVTMPENTPIGFSSPSFRSFLRNQPWLESYASFKARQDNQSAEFHAFLQFLAFSQMRAVRDHATCCGVFLVGDLPLLMGPASNDVETHPSLFRFECVAGAPPDQYNAMGQKWGFPLYNWDEMKKEGFVWWKQRLKNMENFYHLYRIDHVVGLFRLWGIPLDKPPAEGSFFSADPTVWEKEGKERLEMMIDSSSLLPIAEDLGTVPQEVRLVLKKLGICGMKVLRWEKQAGKEYEPLSVSTLSTPDLEPLQLWWKKFPEEASFVACSKQWSYAPDLTPSQRFSLLRDTHHSASYFHINLLQEYLALFPDLVSPHPEEERINVPGTTLPTNWTYRFRPSIEQIIAHEPLAQAMKEIIR